MAMNPAILKQQLKPRLLTLFDDMLNRVYTEDEFADRLAEILSQETVTHITQYASVSTSVDVVSVTGVQTGGGISGPGTGTGTGTIS